MKKTLKIIAIVLFALFVIFSIVSFILWKEQTKEIVATVIDFINKPLPIIGVSIAIIGLFVFKCFVATRYGKKAINEYREENEVLKGQIREQKEIIEKMGLQLNDTSDLLRKKIEEVAVVLTKSLELSKNIKLKALAIKLKGETYGEEETNCDQEEETL